MEKFIVRAWGDGTDFIGMDIFRPTTARADRRGLGDMICEVSNLYAQSTHAEVLVPYIHPALYNFIDLIDMSNRKYVWTVDRRYWESFVSASKDNKSLENVSGRKLLHCYPDFDYVKIDPLKIVETTILNEKYGTIQEMPLAKKCEYFRKDIQEAFLNAQREYSFPLISVHGKEDLGLAKIAYIIKHAEVYIGVDSGMTHFANCIKNKKDVYIYVPKDRISGVTYRWLKQGYDVRLI